MAVQQTTGSEKKNTVGAAFLADFAAGAKHAAWWCIRIEIHRMMELSVVPQANFI